MTDFITIKECLTAKKGSFIGTVIRQSDLKSGTKEGNDWTKKTFTVQDASGEVSLTAWNEEIAKFQVGGKYEFINPWWKEYEGKTSLALGKYATVKQIGSDEIPRTEGTQTTHPTQTTGTAGDPPESRGEINGEPLPAYGNAKWVAEETLELLQIEKTVIEVMTKYKPKISELNSQKVGMFVKEIYRYNQHYKTQV